MNTRKEYQQAYRAMRKWWKLVDSANSATITTPERTMFKAIVDSYEVKPLKAAMESIQARRASEYYTEFPAAERAHRRSLRAQKNQQPYSIDNLPF